jgi:hypothetical protein
MDSMTAFAIALIAMAIVFNLALAFRAYQDSKTKDQNLKEDILAVLLAQRDKQNSNMHLDVSELSAKIDRLHAELSKISADKMGQKNLLPVLGALLEKMNTPTEPQPSPLPKNEPIPSDDHSVFSHAIRLAKENVSPEKIVSICGIDLSEAELIVKIHGAAKD